MGGVKNFSMFKSKISAFFCTKIHSKRMKTHQSIDHWNLNFVKKIQKKNPKNFLQLFSFFQFALSMIFTWYFEERYLHEFLVFCNDFWCKLKLRIYIFKIKSFLPHPKVFYLIFDTWMLKAQFWKSWFLKIFIRKKKGGKKLFEG